MENMTIKHFEPQSYIEIDNPLTGRRIIGLVSDDGSAYLPYLDHDQPATPLPIFEQLEPVDAPSIQAFRLAIYQQDMTTGDLFSEFVSAVIERLEPYDDLTFYRAVKWAVAHKTYDVIKAIDAGKQATSEARALADAIRLAAVVEV